MKTSHTARRTLVKALVLAILARNEDGFESALGLAASLSTHVSPDEIAQCGREALALASKFDPSLVRSRRKSFRMRKDPGTATIIHVQFGDGTKEVECPSRVAGSRLGDRQI